MNKAKRKQLQKASETLAEALEIIRDVRDQEQENLDNMPDSFKESDRGQSMEQIIQYLDDAISYIEDDAMNNIDNAITD